MRTKLDIAPLLLRMSVQDCVNKDGCQSPGWEHPPECRCGLEPAAVCREAANPLDMCMTCHARAALAEAHSKAPEA